MKKRTFRSFRIKPGFNGYYPFLKQKDQKDNFPGNDQAAFYVEVTPSLKFNRFIFGHDWFKDDGFFEEVQPVAPYNHTMLLEKSINQKIASKLGLSIGKDHSGDSFVERFDGSVVRETITEIEFSWIFWTLTFEYIRVVIEW
jgi:hypothetical protein